MIRSIRKYLTPKISQIMVIVICNNVQNSQRLCASYLSLLHVRMCITVVNITGFRTLSSITDTTIVILVCIAIYTVSDYNNKIYF